MPGKVIDKSYVLELNDLAAAEAAPPAGKTQLSVVGGVLQLRNSAAQIQPLGDGPKGITKAFPGERLLADWASFGSHAKPTTAEIQYSRIWLDAGQVLTSLDCFVDDFDAAGASVNIGLYDQVTPGSIAEGPNARVAESEAVAIAAGGRIVGTIKVATVATPYTVPTTGYYWLAIITDNGGGTQNEFLSTKKFPSGYAPTQFEAGATTVLPANATAPASASGPVLFVSAVE